MRHPALRVLSFIVLVATVVRADAVLVAAIALAAAGFALYLRLALAQVARLLWRSRWLFISILVVYLWFTPGTPLVAALDGLSPTWAGLRAGTHRLLALACVILLAGLLFAHGRREDLLAGLYALMRPLVVLGVPRETIVVRLLLVFEYVARLAARPRPRLRDGTGAVMPRLAANLAGAYRRALAEAAREPPVRLAVPVVGMPRGDDYLVFSLVVVLAFVA